MARIVKNSQRAPRAARRGHDGRWEHWQQLPIWSTTPPSTGLHGRGMKTALALILLMMTTTGCALPLRLLNTLSSAPTPDTTPYPKTILHGLVPAQRIDWIGNDTLVFIGYPVHTRTQTWLYAWDLKKSPKQLLEGVSNFCINDNSIMLGKRDPIAERTKHYRIQLPSASVEYLGDQKPIEGFSYRSRYNCQSYPTPQPLLRHNWEELKPGDGYLDFGADGFKRGYAVTHLDKSLQRRRVTGIKVDVPILTEISSWNPQPGYLLQPMGIGSAKRRDWIKTNGLTAWHLDRDLRGHAIKVPAGPWVNTDGGDILILKAHDGLVITTSGFDRDGSPGTAGAYLVQPDGRYQRLETGFVSQPAMSADGCRLAYAFQEYLGHHSRPHEGDRILVVVNLCAKQ